MAWFEGLTSLKGQLTNLAKGVLNDENEGSRNEISSPSSSTSPDNGVSSNTNKEGTGWNDAFLSTDKFIDPATVPVSPWSNEESSHQQHTVEEETITSNKHNPTETEVAVASIIPKGLANFFTQHVSNSPSNNGDKTEKSIQTEGELEQIRTLNEVNRRLQQQNASLTTDVASLTRVVEDLEWQIANSQDVNANLSTGLEELDLQHQQAIEQLVVDRDDVQRQYEALRTRYSELESKYEKELKLRLEEKEKQNDKKDAETMCVKTECHNVSTECENTGPDNVDLMKELEERDNELELVVCENARLREVVKELKEELERQTDSLPAIPENSEEVEALEVRITVLEHESSILREVRTNLETEVASSRTIIEDLTRRLQISDAMIRNQDNSQCDDDKVAAAVREQCEQELQTLRSHCEKVESSLRSLELQSGDALGKLRRELEDKDRRREELERELERLQHEIAEERRQQALNLNVEHASYKKRLTHLHGELQKMDSQVDKLQKEIEQKDKKMCALVFEINSIKEEFEFYKNEMEVKYESLNEDYENLKSTVEKPPIETCDVETQSDDIQIAASPPKMLTNLENEIKHQQELHSKVESDLRLLIKEQELELQGIKDSENKLKQDIESKTALCQNLQTTIDKLNSKIQEIESMNNKFQADYELEKDVLLKQLDSLNTVSNEYDLSKDIFKQKEIEFKNQLQVKDEEFSKFKLMMKENEKEVKENYEQIKELLEKKIVEKDLETEKIKELIKEKNNEENEVVELQTKLTKLEEELVEINKKTEETINENVQRKQFNDELQKRYENVIKSTERTAAEAEEKIIRLLEEVSKLKFDIEQAETRMKESEESSNHYLQMYESIKEEFLKKLETERLENNNKIEELTKEKLQIEEKLSELSKQFTEQIDTIQNENTELTRNLQIKIAECRNNQNEIERLNSVLVTEKTKHEKMLQDKQNEIAAIKLINTNLEEKITQIEEMLKNKNKENSLLSQEVDSLKNQLEYASQLLSVVDRQEAEGQPSAEATLNASAGVQPSVDSPLNASQNQVCPSGCKETQEELNRITGALLKEQTENKLLKNQVEDLTEKVAKTTTQLSRLQSHLLSLEDNYTTELQASNAKLAEMQAKLVQADDRARNSSTAYTSANIRANQQVESLNQQLRLLTEHKEKLDGELSKAEDNIQRQNAAITNLQAVLHQFQRDKQKDIDFETERLRQALNAQTRKNDDLLNELKHLQDQLNETKKGLAAANRLTEQLDQKTEIISTYKKQVDELLTKLKAEEEKVRAAYSNVEGKIDRNLMKNLLVGYVISPQNSKSQVLKVLAQVLDLNKEERQKVGLESGTSAQQQSLSEAFIRFLESESQPKPQVFLPLSQASTSAPPSRKTSQTGSLLLTDSIPNLPHFTLGRNTGSILKDVLKDRNT